MNLLVPPKDSHAQGKVKIGDIYRARSIIGSEFVCGIDSTLSLGEKEAIVPTVSGRAWITGTHQLTLNPDDPWPTSVISNAITGSLLRGSPAELARCHGLQCETGYSDACHLCYESRKLLRSEYPEILTPGQMYGTAGCSDQVDS